MYSNQPESYRAPSISIERYGPPRGNGSRQFVRSISREVTIKFDVTFNFTGSRAAAAAAAADVVVVVKICRAPYIIQGRAPDTKRASQRDEPAHVRRAAIFVT